MAQKYVIRPSKKSEVYAILMRTKGEKTRRAYINSMVFHNKALRVSAWLRYLTFEEIDELLMPEGYEEEIVEVEENLGL